MHALPQIPCLISRPEKESTLETAQITSLSRHVSFGLNRHHETCQEIFYNASDVIASKAIGGTEDPVGELEASHYIIV